LGAQDSIGSICAGFGVVFLALFGLRHGCGGYQFIERHPWLPDLGISYALGVDGFSLPMVLLGALVLFSGVLVSWNVEERPREFLLL